MSDVIPDIEPAGDKFKRMVRDMEPHEQTACGTCESSVAVYRIPWFRDRLIGYCEVCAALFEIEHLSPEQTRELFMRHRDKLRLVVPPDA